MVSPPAPVVCPYITDGLIFWLDGINRGGVSGKWIDLIGGKEFTLYNCAENDDNVQFAGNANSYGLCSGAISNDWNNETLEIATSRGTFKNKCLLCPPTINGATGIGYITPQSSANIWICLSGAQDPCIPATTASRYSLSKNGGVIDGVSKTRQNTDSWGANNTGNTYLGKRQNDTKAFEGKMFSVRIYNRKLSDAEMKANQDVDVLRFYS